MQSLPDSTSSTSTDMRIRRQMPPSPPTQPESLTAPSSSELLRMTIEDRVESSTMSPSLSHDGSRSPSRSSRSDSSSLTTILRSDSNPNAVVLQPSVPTTEICEVCSDKASGYHYGAMSCEGCKGFFGCSVQNKINYSCHKTGQCTVDKLQRNRCQACRFEKCLKKGMTRESVLNDNVNREDELCGMGETIRNVTNAQPNAHITEICEVCSDKASGYHYGVMSCEGCKGFFGCSVENKMNYSCHKTGQCTVDKLQRNRCQACRFEKCLKKGMTKV